MFFCLVGKMSPLACFIYVMSDFKVKQDIQWEKYMKGRTVHYIVGIYQVVKSEVGPECKCTKTLSN